MPKFRKKPVEIEAVRFCQASDGDLYFDCDDLPAWLDEGLAGGVVSLRGDHAWIETLEGGHKASVGDWIIRGVQGEMYPCKPDIFAATYDAVAE